MCTLNQQYFLSAHSFPDLIKNLLPIRPIPYATENRNILIIVELSKVLLTVAALCATLTPYSLYMLRASKCRGVQTICKTAGEASWAILSERLFSKPNLLVKTDDMIGGTVNPPAIVSVSLMMKMQ
jgi:hypothetical protein